MWLASIPDVTAMFTPKSFDELSKIINDWINNGAPTDSDGTSRGSTMTSNEDEVQTTTSTLQNKTASTKSESKKTGNFKNLDDAFSELMDND